MTTATAATKQSLQLPTRVAAELAEVTPDVLDKWIAARLLVLHRGPEGRGRHRVVHEPALLAILLLKLLRAHDVSLEAIRPLSVLLSTRTRDQLEREIDNGNTVLFAAGHRVGFAKSDGFIKNDSGEAVVLLAVNLVTLMSRAAFVIDQYNRRVAAAAN